MGVIGECCFMCQESTGAVLLDRRVAAELCALGQTPHPQQCAVLCNLSWDEGKGGDSSCVCRHAAPTWRMATPLRGWDEQEEASELHSCIASVATASSRQVFDSPSCSSCVEDDPQASHKENYSEDNPQASYKENKPRRSHSAFAQTQGNRQADNLHPEEDQEGSPHLNSCARGDFKWPLSGSFSTYQCVSWLRKNCRVTRCVCMCVRKNEVFMIKKRWYWTAPLRNLVWMWCKAHTILSHGIFLTITMAETRWGFLWF